jgi:hypothetical protein
MEVIGQLHAPAALPPGREDLVPIGYEAAGGGGGHQSLSGRCRYADWDIPTSFYFIIQTKCWLFKRVIRISQNFRMQSLRTVVEESGFL